jgi:hypothetical protein
MTMVTTVMMVMKAKMMKMIRRKLRDGRGRDVVSCAASGPPGVFC